MRRLTIRRSHRCGSQTHDRILSGLLTEMDGLSARPSSVVIVIGTTSRRHAMDAAILRPGRFDQHIAVPLPDMAARRQIVASMTSSMPLAEPRDALLDTIAGMIARMIDHRLASHMRV